MTDGRNDFAHFMPSTAIQRACFAEYHERGAQVPVMRRGLLILPRKDAVIVTACQCMLGVGRLAEHDPPQRPSDEAALPGNRVVLQVGPMVSRADVCGARAQFGVDPIVSARITEFLTSAADHRPVAPRTQPRSNLNRHCRCRQDCVRMTVDAILLTRAAMRAQLSEFRRVDSRSMGGVRMSCPVCGAIDAGSAGTCMSCSSVRDAEFEPVTVPS